MSEGITVISVVVGIVDDGDIEDDWSKTVDDEDGDGDRGKFVDGEGGDVEDDIGENDDAGLSDVSVE